MSQRIVDTRQRWGSYSAATLLQLGSNVVRWHSVLLHGILHLYAWSSKISVNMLISTYLQERAESVNSNLSSLSASVLCSLCQYEYMKHFPMLISAYLQERAESVNSNLSSLSASELCSLCQYEYMKHFPKLRCMDVVPKTTASRCREGRMHVIVIQRLQK